MTEQINQLCTELKGTETSAGTLNLELLNQIRNDCYSNLFGTINFFGGILFLGLIATPFLMKLFGTFNLLYATTIFIAGIATPFIIQAIGNQFFYSFAEQENKLFNDIIDYLSKTLDTPEDSIQLNIILHNLVTLPRDKLTAQLENIKLNNTNFQADKYQQLIKKIIKKIEFPQPLPSHQPAAPMQQVIPNNGPTDAFTNTNAHDYTDSNILVSIGDIICSIPRTFLINFYMVCNRENIEAFLKLFPPHNDEAESTKSKNKSLPTLQPKTNNP